MTATYGILTSSDAGRHLMNRQRSEGMSTIRKQIVTDEANRPVAVQISYDTWMEIERRLGLIESSEVTSDLRRFAGVLGRRLDPLDYQRSVRSEWGD